MADLDPLTEARQLVARFAAHRAGRIARAEKAVRQAEARFNRTGHHAERDALGAAEAALYAAENEEPHEIRLLAVLADQIEATRQAIGDPVMLRVATSYSSVAPLVRWLQHLADVVECTECSGRGFVRLTGGPTGGEVGACTCSAGARWVAGTAPEDEQTPADPTETP